ncbi:MAG: isomerase, partial [Acidimicrobiaceae bacterium]|nr:isomerase [Acidimicrobiaceae bacterium]
MDLPLFQLDAFADRPFEGNPAAVMMLERWPDDHLLQHLATENNLSETAFLVPGTSGTETPPPGPGPTYQLRWFTPSVEVDLCGHATLASAGHLFDSEHRSAERIHFWTRSGWLAAEQAGPGRVRIDLPAGSLVPAEPAAEVLAALGLEPSQVTETLVGTDLVLVVSSPDLVERLFPDLSALQNLVRSEHPAGALRGIAVTARATPAGVTGSPDYVARWFGL